MSDAAVLPDARPVLSLDGAWELHPGGADAPPGPGPGWVPAVVPHQWHPAGLAPEDGCAWYRRRFEAPAAPAGWGAWLCFTGVDDEADVWVDGARRGRHLGAYTPFEVALGELAPGWHDVAVRVAAPPEDAPRNQRRLKGALGWHPTRPGALHPEHGLAVSTGGLWGGVRLEQRPPRHLGALRAVARLAGGRAHLVVDVALAGPVDPEAPAAVALMLADPAGTVVARGGAVVPPGAAGATAVLEVHEPARWWPWELGDQPIYALSARLGDDVLARPVAFRALAREGDVLHVNGVRLFMRGVHHVPDLFASAYDAARAEADMALLREAGVNVVRPHAHVAPPAFYDACDRAGLLVWQDLPLYGGHADDPLVAAEAVRQARAIADLLAPRPCVVGWTAMTDGGEAAEWLAPLVAAELAVADPERRPVVAHASLAGRAVVGDRAAIADLAAPIVHAVGAQALPAVEALRDLLPPGAAWPPAWETWAWHGFDYMQAFGIAGLPDETAPEALVAASQAHQAAFLREALDRLRRARFAPVAGVFAFLFAEPWAGLGWGVLDHARGAKAGFSALAEAYQPLYPSLRLPAGPHRAGLGLRADLVLINDRPEALDGVVVTLSIAGADGAELASVASIPLTVPAGGVARVFPDHGDPLPTHPAWRGRYWIEAVVRRHHRPLARALREVELTSPPPGVAPYRTLA